MNLKEKRNIAKEILKECFWGDIEFNEDDILNIVSGDDFRKNKYLFQKILFNSSDRIFALMIFDKKDLKKLLNDYEFLSSFRKNEIEKRLKLLRNIFFNEKITIPELEWKYRSL